jgi:hypothetical protein
MIPIEQKSYTAEVVFPTIGVGTQVNFGFIAQLEGAEIYGIEVLSETEIGASPNQNFPIDIAGLPSLFVTFVVGESEDLYKIPCSDLNSFYNQGITRSFEKLKINFTKSYVTINSNIALDPLYSICFKFTYTKK